MFQNRVAYLSQSIRQSSTQVRNVCRAPFSSVPVALVAASPLLITEQQDLYQAAFDAARQQLARRSVLQTWNWRNN